MTFKDIVDTEEAIFFYADTFMDDGLMHYWVDSGWVVMSPNDFEMVKDGGIPKEILNNKPEIIFGDIYKTVYAHFLPRPEEGGPMAVITIE
jgi:hypothetical protein